MSARLPVRLNPVKECQRNAEYTGQIPLVQMKRLAALLQAADTSAHCDLRFSTQGRRCYRLEGQLRAELQLECQRCLQPLAFKVQRELRLALVQSEAQVGQIDKSWDPVLLVEETLGILELIEDELILALPDVPMHAESEKCQLSGWAADELEDFEKKPEKPFAALADYKKR